MSIGITFSRRAGRAPACSEVISPRTPQNATARALCCPDAHLAFTRFPPSLGHRDRINVLLDLEIGWVRTAWVRGHPLPMQNHGTQGGSTLVSSPAWPEPTARLSPPAYLLDGGALGRCPYQTQGQMHLLILQIHSESGRLALRNAHAPIMRHYAWRCISIDQSSHYAHVHAN